MAPPRAVLLLAGILILPGFASGRGVEAARLEDPRLDSPEDRAAFVRWFTFLAEIAYFQRPGDVAPEIRDCAGLIRFAYREALRRHDGAWATRLKLPLAPPYPPVAKYCYPHWPLGASLFRISAGAGSAAFAQFADAKTLCRFNTHFVSRELDRAQPGDLLFFEQTEQRLPFHAMVYLGRSHIEPRPERFLIYHTGPIANDPGELRRPSIAELLAHPLPQWRPVAGNSNFLGVFRWNLLRESR